MVADDFTYQYSGNKLASLNNGTYTYAYDANGNCITDGLKNLELKYNFLNLITQVGRASSVKATYRWTADGAKTGVIGEDGRGFEYLGSLIYQYVNGQLQLESAAFGGGRIVATHGSNGTSYTTNHFITDHLGSVRVVMDGSGQVLERNDYYAFGSRWENPASPVSGNRYRFNGKELQTTAEVNYLDYGARMYDQRLGRWHSVDPMAEKYYSISPYVYCNNNPVRYVDPDGKAPGDPFKSIRAAAKDWGMYYNGASILRGKEFASTIYKTTAGGKTFYTYSEANVGKTDNVRRSQAPNGEAPEAIIHSHGQYEKGYVNNDFSNKDKWNSYNLKVDGYVATPDGSLKKYDPYTTKTTVISTDLPSDPKDTDRKNKNDPTDVLMEKKREETRTEQEKKPELQLSESQKINYYWVF